LWYAPPNYSVPNIANWTNMKLIKRIALSRDGIELIKPDTSFFILGSALILRRGRRTLRLLMALI